MERSFDFIWSEECGLDWESMALAGADSDGNAAGMRWTIVRYEMTPWHQILGMPSDRFAGVYRVTGTLGLVPENTVPENRPLTK